MVRTKAPPTSELGPELLRVVTVMLLSGLPTQRLMCQELWPAEYPDNLNSLGARIWDRKLKALPIIGLAMALNPQQQQELLPQAEVRFYQRLRECYGSYQEIEEILLPKPTRARTRSEPKPKEAPKRYRPSELELKVMGALLSEEYSTITAIAQDCWPEEVTSNLTGKLNQRVAHIRKLVLGWLESLLANPESDDGLQPFHTEFLRDLQEQYGFDYEKVCSRVHRFKSGGSRKSPLVSSSPAQQPVQKPSRPTPPVFRRVSTVAAALEDFQEGAVGPQRTIEVSDAELRVLGAIFYHTTPDFNKYRLALSARLPIVKIEGSLIVSALSKLGEALKHRERGGRLNHRSGRIVVEIHRRFPGASLDELIQTYHQRNGSPIDIKGGSSIRRGVHS